MIATRGVLTYATGRLASMSVLLISESKSLSPDGSFSLTQTEREVKCYLTELSNTEIQSLREGGISIISGVTCTINEELENIPDQVKHRKLASGEYADVSFVTKYSRAEGITNLILDTSSMQPAGSQSTGSV